MSHRFLNDGQFRQATPAGVSPDEQWHGPYEVVQHPSKGTFHVVDNQGRAATSWDTERRGRPDPKNASESRDYIDSRRAMQEKATGVADRIFEGFAQTLGYQDSDHMATTQQNRRDESFMLDYPGAKWSDAHEQMVLKIPAKNGWYGIHRGGYTDIHHEKYARNIPVDTIPHRDGWPSVDEVKRHVGEWVDEQGPSWEPELPYHRDQ